MIKLEARILSHFDFIQPILILPIIIFSFILVNEANPILGDKQIIYFIIGLLAFCLCFILPIRRFSWLIPVLYWINIALLFSVDILGTSRLGAKRWLEIPFTHFTIQPSELLKPAFMLMLAYLIYKNPPPLKGYGLKKFIMFSFYILLPFLLISAEPDLGTAAILLIVGYGTLFIIGVNYRIWLAIAVAAALLAPLAYTHLLKPYQKQRIHDFISAEPSYHVKQSLIAIGNGGLSGKSTTEATQTHFKFLPIATSDFIFAYTIERYGFIGGLLLMLCYLFLIIHLLSLNYRLKDDYLTKTVVNAIALFLFVYIGVNISMTIGFAPVVGVPLPFFSHGGSSFTTFMIFFGILENLLTFRYLPISRAVKIVF